MNVTHAIPVHTLNLLFYVIQPQKYIKSKTCFNFFLLKNPQQVLKFYPQILRKEASFYIYHSQLTQLTDIAYVITSVYDAQNLRRKLVFAVLQR